MTSVNTVNNQASIGHAIAFRPRIYSDGHDCSDPSDISDQEEEEPEKEGEIDAAYDSEEIDGDCDTSGEALGTSSEGFGGTDSVASAGTKSKRQPRRNTFTEKAELDLLEFLEQENLLICVGGITTKARYYAECSLIIRETRGEDIKLAAIPAEFGKRHRLETYIENLVSTESKRAKKNRIHNGDGAADSILLQHREDFFHSWTSQWRALKGDLTGKKRAKDGEDIRRHKRQMLSDISKSTTAFTSSPAPLPQTPVSVNGGNFNSGGFESKMEGLLDAVTGAFAADGNGARIQRVESELKGQKKMNEETRREMKDMKLLQETQAKDMKDMMEMLTKIMEQVTASK